MEGFARWGLCFIRKSIGLVNPFSAIYPWLMKLTHHTSFSPFPFDVFDFVIGMNTRGPHAIHTFMPRKWNLLNETLVFSIFQQNETASHLTCITHQESDAVWFPKLTNTKGRNRHFLAGNKSWKRSRTTNFFQHFWCDQARLLRSQHDILPQCRINILFVYISTKFYRIVIKGERMDTIISMKKHVPMLILL